VRRKKIQLQRKEKEISKRGSSLGVGIKGVKLVEIFTDVIF